MGCLVVESREVQIEQVITRFTHQVQIRTSFSVTDSLIQEPLGITIDLESLSWETLRGSAIAYFDLLIWAYLPFNREIQAISRSLRISTYVAIPGLTPSMSIEAKYHVEDIEVAFGESGNEIIIEALIVLEGLGLEKRIIHVVTGVSMENGADRIAEGEEAPARPGFLSAIGNLLKGITGAIRANRPLT